MTAPTFLTEAAFQHAVVDLAKMQGWSCFHAIPTMNRRGRWATHSVGRPGWPDLTLARGGVVLFRELKLDKTRTTADQEWWLKELGDLAAVWRPRDWPLIVKTLRRVA